MCCFSLLFRDLLPWGCQLCFDSQMGWEIFPAADSDIFFPVKERAWQSSVPLLVKRESVCSLSKCLLCIYYLCLDFFSLCSFIFCTQRFSPSQQKAQLDPSDGTPRRDFWSLMIICLPPPGTFPLLPSRVVWQRQLKDKAFISLPVWPCHAWLWDRGPLQQLYLHSFLHWSQWQRWLVNLRQYCFSFLTSHEVLSGTWLPEAIEFL